MNQSIFEPISAEEENVEPFFRYIKDSEHESIIREYLGSVKKSLYIATGDFKQRVEFDGMDFACILDEMAKKGEESHCQVYESARAREREAQIQTRSV